MNDYFWERDFTNTVRDYDFTRRAVKRIHKVVTSEDFEAMDAEKMVDFLYREMEIVHFNEYLKRYIYQNTDINKQCAFDSVDNSYYRDTIMYAFEIHNAPHSFSPTKMKWSAMVKRWLEQDSVQRSTIFLLGFGLGMSSADVTEFLTKVIKESNFNLYDPWEVICRYCFYNTLPYAKALALMNAYKQMPVQPPEESMAPPKASCDEAKLLAWLGCLKSDATRQNAGSIRRECFMMLYRGCQEVVAELKQTDEDIDRTGKEWRPEDITPADIEQVLCDGIPTTSSGNLEKMSKSLLNRHFEHKRISRQRLNGLLKGDMEIERFDLITLQFLISSQKEDDDPSERCKLFMDAINDILERCGMMKLYPVNSYEAFVLICLLWEDPLVRYYEVWEQSYQEA